MSEPKEPDFQFPSHKASSQKDPFAPDLKGPNAMTEAQILAKTEEFYDKRRTLQNLPLAIAGGFAAIFVYAFFWGLLVFSSGMPIKLMALGVGFMVGYVFRFLGKGFEVKFSVWGLVISFLGCLLGSFVTQVVLVSKSLDLGVFEVLGVMNYAILPESMFGTLGTSGLIFWVVTMIGAYRTSVKPIEKFQLNDYLQNG